MQKIQGPKYLFFVGKGGVGKSTCSVSTAFATAAMKNKTLIVSLDPAHNLSDILETSLYDQPKEIKDSLYAMEINIEQRLEEYLKKTIHMMKKLYAYLKVINLERFFDVLRFSPGMEEYAVILALEDIFESYKDMDFIIIDTPPTALTLRFFALPELSLLWIENLIQLRRKILSKRASIKNVLGEKSDNEESLPSSLSNDLVFKELLNYEGRLKTIKSLFSSKKDTFIFLLLNPERLSVIEGGRILKAFEKFSMTVKIVIINKVGLYNENAQKNLYSLMDNFYIDLKKKCYDLKTIELPLKKTGPLTREDLLGFGKNILKKL